MTLPAPTLPQPEPAGKRLRAAWVTLLGKVDAASPAEWFVNLTFADNIHPEQADKYFCRLVRRVNQEIFGRRYREQGRGVWAVRATEYQRRGVLHYHAIMGGGVRVLRRLTWGDIWKDMTGGWGQVLPYDRNRGALRYLTKYVVKGGDIDIFLPPDLEQLLRGGLLQQTLRRV